MEIDELLALVPKNRASDLHLTAGLPPMLRIDGRLVPTQYEKLTPHECQRLVYSMLTDRQKQKFEETLELDLSYGVAGIGRFRVNVYWQRGSVGAAMRAIPAQVPSAEELNLPPLVRELAYLPRGLILVTGPTGSGKSTTQACMIDIINSERRVHIVTIEDPIEYLHRHKLSMINQRELGLDTLSFQNALRAVLREDPDVILIGEMRDYETIAAALTIAETGHLVIATLHTNTAAQSIDRIVDVFPPHQQPQIRTQLSYVLEAILCQQLIPRAGGIGRVPAIEILIATPAVRNLIRENKTAQINAAMQTGSKYGMQTMDMALKELYVRGLITYEDALQRAVDPEDFKKLVRAG
jgi:twitching motility protein PilT